MARANESSAELAPAMPSAAEARPEAKARANESNVELAPAMPSAAETRPEAKVVVGIVVDQLRSDYVEKFFSLYGENGFKRLWSEGMVYTNGTFDFVSPERASATASIYTGANPSYHGIIGNRYLDRKTLRVKACVDDASFRGLNTSELTSPAPLLVTTLSDELKIATNGHAKVYSVAPERDMAVIAGGHAADAVVWMNDDDGQWSSSMFYGKNLPTWLTTYNRRSGTSYDFRNLKWTPYYSPGVYLYSIYDGAPTAFVHTFSEKNIRRYKTSALINDEVSALARNFLLNDGLFGHDNTTDMLCLGFYAGNYDHQSEQYSSLELQDIYCRLDRNIAEVLSAVEQKVSKDNMLVFLTSTGYTDVHQPAVGNYSLPTGEVRMERCIVLLNMYLGALYGTGSYAEASFMNQIYLNHKLLEEKQLKLKDVQERCIEFLGQMSGVKRVFASVELMGGLGNDAVRNTYHAERSGDLILEIAPGWAVVDERWNEKRWVSRAQVPMPVVFFGLDIEPGHSGTPLPYDAIAPTVTSLLKVKTPNACAAGPLQLSTADR
jgi:hypothetical protein